MIYPDAYFNKVEEITIEFLNKNKIKALILDIDNTLIDYSKIMTSSVENWAKNLKGQGVKIYILSNSNKKKKVENIAKILDVPYIYFGKKPLKMGFKKVIFPAKNFKSVKKFEGKIELVPVQYVNQAIKNLFTNQEKNQEDK